MGDRAFNGADHVGDADFFSRLGQPVAAFGSASGPDDAGVFQVEQDVLEKLKRNVLRIGKPFTLYAARF